MMFNHYTTLQSDCSYRMSATHERTKVRVHREHEGFEEEAAVQRNGLEIDGLRGVVDRGLARDRITWEKSQRSMIAQEPIQK